MFQPNFDDFFGSEHHQNRPWAEKVKNRVRMTTFCIRNIPTMFKVHLLLLAVSTTKNYFGRILMIILGTDTLGAGKLEHRA